MAVRQGRHGWRSGAGGLGRSSPSGRPQRSQDSAPAARRSETAQVEGGRGPARLVGEAQFGWEGVDRLVGEARFGWERVNRLVGEAQFGWGRVDRLVGEARFGWGRVGLGGGGPGGLGAWGRRPAIPGARGGRLNPVRCTRRRRGGGRCGARRQGLRCGAWGSPSRAAGWGLGGLPSQPVSWGAPGPSSAPAPGDQRPGAIFGISGGFLGISGCQALTASGVMTVLKNRPGGDKSVKVVCVKRWVLKVHGLWCRL
jgi:hypothetical protein